MKFDLAYEQISTPVILVTRSKGLIVSVNSNAEDLTGLSRQDLIGKPFVTIIAPVDRQRAEAVFDDNLNILKLKEPDVTVIRKSGRRVHVDLNYNLLQIIGNELIVVSLHDITEMKLAAAKIKQAKDYVEKIFDNLSDIIIIIENNGIIKDINVTGTRILGHSKKDLVGRNLVDLIENGQQMIPKLFRSLKRTQKIVNTPVTLVPANQKKLSTLLSGSIIHSPLENKPGAVLAFADISKLREAQHERERALKMVAQSSKLAAIGQLSAGVAHELNNPLAIIQGFTENIDLLAENNVVNKEQLKAQIGPIFNAVGRMVKIISSMKNMTRNSHFEMCNCDLRDIVDEVLFLLDKRFKSHNVEVIAEVLPPSTIQCDPTKIQQILINILSNALHSMENQEKPGVIKIGSSTANQGQEIHLNVWNNGIPIPVDIHDRIFDPFFTTKQVGEGTGLGLSISYDIMKQHSGELTFTSSSKDGTNFVMRFPQVISEISPNAKHSSRVLVVDDETYFRQLISKKLSAHGFEVVEARNGEEALHILRNQVFQCIFTDLKMPKIDGRELVAAARNLYPETKIIVVTDHIANKDINLVSMKLGVHGILRKPINNKMLAKVLKLLEENRDSAA